MFQIVLYYKKKVTFGKKKVIAEMIEESQLDYNSDNIDNVLDEYSKTGNGDYREEIVDTFVLIDDDENFIKEVGKIEKDDFIEWKNDSLEIIKQKL